MELDDNGDPVGDRKDLGERPVLEFVPGQTYKFDMSDSTNGIHPLHLSRTSTYDAASAWCIRWWTNNYDTNAPGTEVRLFNLLFQKTGILMLLCLPASRGMGNSAIAGVRGY